MSELAIPNKVSVGGILCQPSAQAEPFQKRMMIPRFIILFKQELLSIVNFMKVAVIGILSLHLESREARATLQNVAVA